MGNSTTLDKQSVGLGNSKYFNRPSGPYVFGCYLTKDFNLLIKEFRKYARNNHYHINYTYINSIVACDLEDALSEDLTFLSYKNAYKEFHKNYKDDLSKGLNSYFVLLKIIDLFYNK